MDSIGKTRRREEKERWQGFGRDAASTNEDQALLPQSTKYGYRMSLGESQP
jgi:hypothetical protein